VWDFLFPLPLCRPVRIRNNSQKKQMSETQRVCNGKLIFRRYRKDRRTGKQIDARVYGFNAWPICIGSWEAKEKAVPTGTT
jgi:hypothetical protein